MRGSVNNPFNSQTAKLQPKLSLKGNGPFPGDVTVYTFDLYSSAQLQKKVGSAAYTCYFNYASHALCLAYYELSGPKGSLVASGSLDFAQTGFTLVVTGGTLHYLGAASGRARRGQHRRGRPERPAAEHPLQPGEAQQRHGKDQSSSCRSTEFRSRPSS